MFYATIAGNLGRDAELRNAGGTDVLNFSVAVQTGFGQREKTEWVGCAIWGRRGRSLAQYLTKGTPVTAIGEFSTREHEGQTYLEMRVQEIKLQGKMAVGDGQAAAPASVAQRQAPAVGGDATGASLDDIDDDFPF